MDLQIAEVGKHVKTAGKRPCTAKATAGGLLRDVRGMIASARERAAASVNAELTMLYWHVGRRINKEVLKDKRAAYGRQVVGELAGALTDEFGPGWDVKTLRHSLRVAETFSERQIVSAVRRQLSWTHIKSLAYIADPLKREFYIEMCALEHWSSRTLQGRINSMMYKRTAIAKKPDEVIKKDIAALRDEGKMSADLAFRDPYVLDFLGLHGLYSEKDLEKALLADMRNAILELGGGKTFLAAASVKKVFDRLPTGKAKFVVWLVPSDAILTQTVANLSNPDHPYRRRLDRDFGGAVNVYTKEQLLNGQNFKPADVMENLASPSSATPPSASGPRRRTTGRSTRRTATCLRSRSSSAPVGRASPTRPTRRSCRSSGR